MTPAGASFPYGIDPEDKNIRIAPSFPGEDEIRSAMNLFALCVKLVSTEKYMNELPAEGGAKAAPEAAPAEA